ncbi:hypothetical protein M407DRAFT_29690 [Tulasnella calospora MUT 4182]|uniref:Uncharacterized protein n=1 Tax=Tulasnella calospora MUT 4182 TaxID=1051891 RepID=A0A0C3Q9M3_9AGAM|nr:hypothetical protein M407DRAFT_29690 [Tulasnella calospora MUT 4182]
MASQVLQFHHHPYRKMPPTSPPVFTPEPFKLSLNIIKPVARLKIATIDGTLICGGRSSHKAGGPNSLISSGIRFALKPGVGQFVNLFIKQMEKTEVNFKDCIDAEAVELGLHWLLGRCLEQLVEELKWAKEHGQACLYQSIWNLIILWAGGWPGDPYSRAGFQNACRDAGLKPYSKNQFECALKIFESGTEQASDTDHILPRRPKKFQPLWVAFPKGGKYNFDGITIMFGYERAVSRNDRVPAPAYRGSEADGFSLDELKTQPSQSALLSMDQVLLKMTVQLLKQ